MIVVRKTVQGPATGGFTAVVSCEAVRDETLKSPTTLNFDTTGVPTTVSGNTSGWSIVDDAW